MFALGEATRLATAKAKASGLGAVALVDCGHTGRLGGYGERVEEPGALRAALQRCIAETEQGRPALLEVITKEEGRMAKA
jgi:LDH2 family malate/lactate/ureidoglycolate dehydrogenase